MAIEGVNTAMTAMQFTRARSLTRSVETADSSSSQSSSGRQAGFVAPLRAQAAVVPVQPHRLIAPATFHFTYRPLPGKSVAKKLPQLADSKYWSFALDRVG